MISELYIMIGMIVFVYCVGHIILKSLFNRLLKNVSPFVTIPLSWALGNTALIFFLHMLFFYHKLSFITLDNFLWLFIVVFCVFILLLFHYRQTIESNSILFDSALFIILFLLFIPLLHHATISYLVDWDPVAIWFLKAKALFLSSSLVDMPYFFNSAFSYSHKAYPIGIPLVISAYYRLVGFVQDQIAQLYFALYFINTIFITLGVIRMLFSKKASVWLFFVVWAFFVTPIYIMFSHNGYLDISLGFFYTLSTALLLLAQKTKVEKRMSFFPLFFITSSTPALIKSEGVLFSAIGTFVFLLMAFRPRIIKTTYRTMHSYFILFVSLCSTIIPFVLWEYIKRTYHIRHYFELVSFPNDIVFRTKSIIYHCLDTMFNTQLFGVTLFILIAILIVEYTILCIHKKWFYLYASFMILGVFGAYVCFYLISPIPISLQLTSSFSRLLLHLLPSLFIIALYQSGEVLHIIKKDIL